MKQEAEGPPAILVHPRVKAAYIDMLTGNFHKKQAEFFREYAQDPVNALREYLKERE